MIINNFLKHFAAALLIFFGYILIQYLSTKTIMITSEIWIFIIMIVGDLLLAGIKALEEWNEEWAEKFQWFLAPFFEFLTILIKAIVKKFAKNGD